jgi:hypothetical protein
MADTLAKAQAAPPDRTGDANRTFLLARLQLALRFGEISGTFPADYSTLTQQIW